MDSLASEPSPSALAQDVQQLRDFLGEQARLDDERLTFEQQQMMQGIDRSARNRMSDEIVSMLGDAMSIMKKTGDEARNSGR